MMMNDELNQKALDIIKESAHQKEAYEKINTMTEETGVDKTILSLDVWQAFANLPVYREIELGEFKQ